MATDFDAVVIGSGFGGAVSALRPQGRRNPAARCAELGGIDHEKLESGLMFITWSLFQCEGNDSKDVDYKGAGFKSFARKLVRKLSHYETR